MLDSVIQKLHLLSSPVVRKTQMSFFKTNHGQYAHGDIFIGVSIPNIRILAKQVIANNAQLHHIEQLLLSPTHEHRMLGLIVLVEMYQKQPVMQSQITDFYLSENILAGINNWDLVDISCYKILGKYCIKNEQYLQNLYDFAQSKNLWKRRIAIVSTLTLIKNSNHQHTLKIATQLLNDKEDLIHKATGWMLREVGKKNEKILTDFLAVHCHKMPSVMLSYATEKLTLLQKQHYRKLKKQRYE
jgi:3-methyladenine DNA glycosylase AlkD